MDPAASVPLVVTLDAGAPATTWTGTYSGELSIQHDTPYTPLTVPVTLTVIASPCLPLTGTALSWTPLEPTIGAVIIFAGTAAGSLPLTFTWNQGDGGTGRGAHPTHTYTTGGDYTVELTARSTIVRASLRMRW